MKETPYAIVKRYKRSEIDKAQYHEIHDNEVKEDPILNLNSPKNLGIGALLPVKRNIIHVLQKRYVRKEYFENKLSELEENFQRINKDRKVKALPPLTEYPRELLNERYVYEAKLDVNQTVINTLEYRLKVGDDAEKETGNSKCLMYGPRQSAKQDKEGKLLMLDYQKISYNENNEAFIDDENSPYNGELVASYRNLSNWWLNERQSFNTQKLIRLQEQCKEKGLPIPTQLKVSSIKEIDKNSLPKMRDEFRVNLIPEKK